MHQTELELPTPMVAAYLSRRGDDLRTLSQSLGAEGVEKFNQIGHQLLGSAASYGFKSLEPIASRMEQLSKGDLKILGPQLLSEYKDWLAKARVDFHSQLLR